MFGPDAFYLADCCEVELFIPLQQFLLKTLE